MKKTKPFLKWPGNKYRCIEKILEVLPPAQRFVEPFMGSGAVFMNAEYPQYLLAEGNADLIHLFHYVQSQGASFIDYCKTFFIPENNEACHYYQLRSAFNTTKDKRERAALMLYLNRHGYNGLCRYNQSGIFNVPFGRYIKPYFPEKELAAFHEKSRMVTFVHKDFRTIFEEIKEGDVVYCDPPYAPLSDTAKFTAYNGRSFHLDDQIALTALAKKAAQKGATVVISNHDTPFIRAQYQDAQINSFLVSRFINCNTARRQPVHEVLAVFKP